MRKLTALFLGFSCLLLAESASARTVEPGSVSFAAGLGPAVRLGSRLGGSGGYLMLQGEAEYAASSSLGAVGDVSWGLAGTMPLRLNLGARFRMTGLDLPISPYFQVQAAVGRLFDVINTNLNFVGGRAGVGLDYFLTANTSVAGLLGVTLGSTMSSRSAFYGIFEGLVSVRYSL